MVLGLGIGLANPNPNPNPDRALWRASAGSRAAEVRARAKARAKARVGARVRARLACLSWQPRSWAEAAAVTKQQPEQPEATPHLVSKVS
tara:strand:+ start:322 stop:591 length:270 start_codon:yes stop_codon:yes gene_type:complete